jgi:hypothetical protein
MGSKDPRRNQESKPPPEHGTLEDEGPTGQGLSLGPLCTQPQSASSTTFFDLMHWRYDESDDGN